MDGIFYSLTGSILCVLSFNYFFTVPYYSLRAYSPEYPVTFVVMLIIAFITSSMTSKIKSEKNKSEYRENHLKILYKTTSALLSANSIEEIAKLAATYIADFLNYSVFIYTVDVNMNLSIKYISGEDKFSSPENEKAYIETFISGNPCGKGSNIFSNLEAYYFPIYGQSGNLGVIGISSGVNILDDDTINFLHTFSTEISLAIEREIFLSKEKNVKLDIEKEIVRSNFLRSISHDIRTPLAGILGSATTLKDNYNVLDDNVKQSFLNDIIEETEWLNRMVENVLYITRFDEDSIENNFENYPLEELVGAALARIKKSIPEAVIEVNIPKVFTMIYVDATLIVQVLINLLNNAIKYSPEGSKVTLNVFTKQNKIIFEVINQGFNFRKKDLPHIFDRFYTVNDNKSKYKGFGIGLNICKTIVNAHNGEIHLIKSKNNETIFRFELPLGGE